MAAITDLNWTDFNAACVTFGLTTSLEVDENDYTAAPESFTIELEELGVVKTLSKLLEVARHRQEVINQNQQPEDQLSSFPEEEVGVARNGYVPIARAVIAGHGLASATDIIGINNY